VVLVATPDKVWAKINDWHKADWLPGVHIKKGKKKEGKSTRTIKVISSGKSMTEQLDSQDDDDYVMEYSVQGKCSLPFTSLKTTLAVTPVGKSRARLSWSCTCEPTDGNQTAAKEVLSRLYEGGLSNIKIQFEG